MGIAIGGKRKDNGEWVYGAYFYVHHTDGRNHTHHFIIPNGVDMSIGTPIEKIQVEVDPATMGVFYYDGYTEPTELLFVEKEEVVEYYKYVQQAIDEENGDTKIEMKGREYAMLYLFGDKCVPDKEPSAEPKFKAGDKAKVNDVRYNQVFGAFGIVKGVKKIGEDFFYTLENDTTFRECYLEPYTEPETKEPKCVHPDSGNCKWKNICDHTQCYFDPIKPETEDNMEEKERNKSILPGDLIEIKGKETNLKGVITELTDSKYVKIQPIGLTCTIYVERQILIKDNPELYGK